VNAIGLERLNAIGLGLFVELGAGDVSSRRAAHSGIRQTRLWIRGFHLVNG
jgi:hypothetical protein